MFSHLSTLFAPHALSFLALIGLGTTAVDPGPAAGDADGADDDDPGAAPAGKPSVADAGRKYLASLTPDQLNREFDDLEVEGDHDDDNIDAGLETPITRDDGATWNSEAGRWQNADGQFVAGDPPADAPATPVATPAPADGAKHADGASTWTKVSLPATRDGDKALELEIDDPAIVERLNDMRSEAIRARSLQKRQGDVEQQASELAEIDRYLTSDPVGFTLSRMTPDRQLEVARALLLEHFDELMPDIETYHAEPVARERSRVELRDSMTASRDRMAQETAMAKHAGACIRAAEAMIPETADDQDAQEFIADARTILAQLATAGERVTPDTVPQLLERRAKLYGFTPGTTGTGPAAPAAAPVAPAARSAPAAATPAARPVTDRARDMAARQSVKEAASKQARIRQVQTQRAAAGRVAPAGAGAAPVQTPVLPDSAKTDVRAASRHLRQSGKLSESWAPAKNA